VLDSKVLLAADRPPDGREVHRRGRDPRCPLAAGVGGRADVQLRELGFSRRAPVVGRLVVAANCDVAGGDFERVVASVSTAGLFGGGWGMSYTTRLAIMAIGAAIGWLISRWWIRRQDKRFWAELKRTTPPNAELLKLVKSSPAPQEWYNEDEEELFS